MLRDLAVRDILLIESLALEFQPGLNVLTGETGAGKSILLDCLGFVLGWRGRADIVRPGAAEGEVSAVFDLGPGHSAHDVLKEAGLPVEEGEVILRRVVTPDGRKRAFVNDRRASAEVLRSLSDTLVELHGQQDDRGLLNPRGHLALLDAFADAPDAVLAVRAAWRDLAAASRALEDARVAQAAAARDVDYLTHAVDELDRLDPHPGEDDALDTRRRLMQAAERIREDVRRAAQATGSDGATGQASDALRWLEGVADRAEGGLEEPMAALSRALHELAEAERGIEDMIRALTGDPGELEEVEERLFAIRGLARKHNVLPDALADLAADLRDRLARIDAADDEIAGLAAELADRQAAYDGAARTLGKTRATAARRLDKAMARELSPLKLDRARFVTELAPSTPGWAGCETAQFQISTTPGADPGPLARIASGGELSRFLLALKVCLRGSGDATMIFDEIDRGVGGATADAVGRRLHALAEAGQVIVVTHAPQVAARARHHWQVSKRVRGAQTRTDVVPLTADERVDEIARMLAGENVSSEARSAAKVLLES